MPGVNTSPPGMRGIITDQPKGKKYCQVLSNKRLNRATISNTRFPLLEDEVRDFGLEIPIDHPDRGQVESGVRDHQQR